MLNHKGSTLIESLLALSLFVSVLIMLVTLLTSIYRQEQRIHNHYQILLEKEGILSYRDNFLEIVEMVLH